MYFRFDEGSIFKGEHSSYDFSSLFLEPLRVFYFLWFYFVFGADFEELATRGALATVE